MLRDRRRRATSRHLCLRNLHYFHRAHLARQNLAILILDFNIPIFPKRILVKVKNHFPCFSIPKLISDISKLFLKYFDSHLDPPSSSSSSSLAGASEGRDYNSIILLIINYCTFRRHVFFVVHSSVFCIFLFFVFQRFDYVYLRLKIIFSFLISIFSYLRHFSLYQLGGKTSK